MTESFEEHAKSLKNRQANLLISRIILKISGLITGIKFIENKIKSGYDGFKPDLYLEDGQELNKYGFNAIVLHIPGHTKGSIGILTENNDLISGDILRNYGKPAVSPQGEDLNKLNASLERLKRLKINKVYPGHGKPFNMNELF